MTRFLLFLFVCVTASVQAATYYVTQAGAGSANGSTLGNAFSVSGHNAAIFAAGDIIILNGTITSTIAPPNSGSSGSLITYTFAAGAKFSKPAWGIDASSAIYVNGKNYVKIDGGGAGIIECTANGTGLANTASAFGVELNTTHHCEVTGLIIQNLYVRTAGSTETTGASTTGIHASDSGGNNLVYGNTISNVRGGVSFLHSATISGDKIYNNTISKRDSGIVYASSASGIATAVQIYWNSIGSAVEWDEPGDNFHHDGFHTFTGGGQTGHLTGVRLFNNTFTGDRGLFSTADIFFEDSHSGALVYSNIHVNSTSGHSPSDGYIFIKGNGTSAAAKVLNNTVVISGGAGGTAYAAENSSGNTFQNNVLSSSGATVTGMSLHDVTSRTGASINNNVYFGTVQYYDGTSIYSTLSSWTAARGFDAASSTATPNLNSTYFPVATSSAIGGGIDQSATFTLDAAGAAWAGGTGWGRGAKKVAGGGVVLPTPNPSTISTTGASSTQVAVTATTTTASALPVQYNFAINGTYAGWQASNSHTFIGLTPATSYAFKVQARDASLNTTTESAISNVSTTGTIPTITSATIPTSGLNIAVALSASCTTGLGGSGGFTITTTGSAVTVSSVAGSGSSTYTLTTSRPILPSEVVRLNYVQPGNGVETTTDGVDLPSFTLRAVTNNSTYVAPTAPSVASLSIPTGGTTLAIVWNQSASIGVGGSTGFTLAASAGAMTGTYSTGAPGTTTTLTLSRTAVSGETIQLSYTNPGNGFEGTTGGIDVANFSGLTVFNQSTQGIPTTTPTVPPPGQQKPKKKR